MKNNYISKNFTYNEIFRYYNIDQLDKNIVARGVNLVNEILQPARNLLGKSLIITSGYRSPEHNKKVGGAVNSKHLFLDCAAVDLYCPELSGKELYKFFIENFYNEIGGAGLYFPENEKAKFIHIDNRKKQNGAITTWYYNGSDYLKIPLEHHNLFVIQKSIKFI